MKNSFYLVTGPFPGELALAHEAVGKEYVDTLRTFGMVTGSIVGIQQPDMIYKLQTDQELNDLRSTAERIYQEITSDLDQENASHWSWDARKKHDQHITDTILSQCEYNIVYNMDDDEE